MARNARAMAATHNTSSYHNRRQALSDSFPSAPPGHSTMTMFSFNSAHKKQDPETAPSGSPIRKKLVPRRWRGREDKKEEEPENLSPVRFALSEDTFHGSETEIGIEISLDWDAEEEAEEEENLPAVLNLGNQMKKRNKVYRSQFSVDFPILEREEEVKPSDPLRRGHRVPLWETDEEKDGYKEALALLKKHPLTDEIQSVSNELGRLNNEIEALEEDRLDLDNVGKRRTPKINLTKKVSARQWDIHEWLALGECDFITVQERKQLEQRRGSCLTFHLHCRKSREAFMSTFGWDGGRTSYLPEHRKSAIVSLDPDNCKEAGAGEKIRHVAISGGRGDDTSFFISRDRDKASTWGYLPEKLFMKMKGAGMDARHDLVYLSTGPQRCYYAEFRSGDCWWGSALKDDKDFQRIVQNWDVYRLAFGPIVTYADDDGHKWTTNSWIILARDGRAAWKNLPSRLHQKLESRLADWPAPAEVTLGSDGSYFVRFLDGTIDYCLPAEVASVCEYIESSGGQITDMMLHPDVSQDFVIRHTQIKR